MNGNRYLESTARKEVFDLLKQCGPLTLSQIEKLRKRQRSFYVIRHLLKQRHIGILPTYPAQFVAGPHEYTPTRNVSPAMREVLDALEKFQPATALELADRLGKSRQNVAAYLRIARIAGFARRSGEIPARGIHRAYAYLWVMGAGENYVRSLPGKSKNAPTPTTVSVHRDPLVAAFFGAAA
jgi:hypothetical protein